MLRFFLIFAIVWWLVFFMALPFGAEPPKKPKKGHASSAPEVPHLRIKVIATTVIAAILSGTILYMLRINDLW